VPVRSRNSLFSGFAGAGEDFRDSTMSGSGSDRPDQHPKPIDDDSNPPSINGSTHTDFSPTEVAPRNAWLLVFSQEGFERMHEMVPGRIVAIGRAPENQIVLHGEGTSRRHAEVQCRDSQWQVEDLKSTNGTFVFDRRIDAAYTLVEKDRIRIGQNLLIFTREPPTNRETSERQRISDIGPKSPSPIPDAPDPLKRTAEFVVLAPPARPDEAWSRKVMEQCLSLGLEISRASAAGQLAQLVANGLASVTGAEFAGVYRQVTHGNPVLLAGVAGANRTYRPLSAGEVTEAIMKPLGHPAKGKRGEPERQRLVIAMPTSRGNGDASVLLHVEREGNAAFSRKEREVIDLLGPAFLSALGRLERDRHIEEEVRQLRRIVVEESELIGHSPPIQTVRQQISLVARSKATVLIRGESGVGKELVARSIHEQSERRSGPFIALNCASLQESLLESELFGHEKGSFTGATEARAGRFEQASGGTIFLDEIGELSHATQAKLLRVLDGHPFERVGGSRPIRTDVRVLAATNRNLEEAVQQLKFRQDLYFRLRVVEIQVPPLRERREDITALANHFLRRFATELGRKVRGFSPRGVQKLATHAWPGNIRELKNAIERTVVLTSGELIEAEDLFLSVGGHAAVRAEGTDDWLDSILPISIDDLEKKLIARTLRHTGWNKTQASQQLGIERSTLDRKIRRYDIQQLEDETFNTEVPPIA
jgi:Nif-specific regulatory protein